MVGQGFAEGGEDVAELALADVAVPFLVKHLEAGDKVVWRGWWVGQSVSFGGCSEGEKGGRGN